ncbi:DUF3501 family protein [Roseateles sp. BYS87W]|uniref:DUF3501 family protein n=1 Tax=Pelomonas baiyunensis TaxID=3299026 RepID=A0ABW7GXB9_9BURK
MAITPESLLTLEAYARCRAAERPAIAAHRRLRSVQLTEHLLVQFEDERTVRHQIQEMLRIEKIFEPEGIQQEIDAYQSLVPTGRNWTATMLLTYPDATQRREALRQLIGVEDRMYVQVGATPRVYAIADEDLDRETAEKTSAVHFLRFELSDAQCAAARQGAELRVGCDHAHLVAELRLTAGTAASLVADLG